MVVAMTGSASENWHLLQRVGATHVGNGQKKYFRCPVCSDTRSGGNKRKKCLVVRGKDDGLGFDCFNCGWGGFACIQTFGQRRGVARQRAEDRPSDFGAAGRRIRYG